MLNKSDQMLNKSDQMPATPYAFLNINKNLSLSHVIRENHSVTKAHHMQAPVMQHTIQCYMKTVKGKCHQHHTKFVIYPL